jgi:hypothetical protein
MVLPHVAKYVKNVRCMLIVVATLCFASVFPVACATAAHPETRLLVCLLPENDVAVIILVMCDKSLAQVLSSGADCMLAITPPAQNRDNAIGRNRGHSRGCHVILNETFFTYSRG